MKYQEGDCRTESKATKEKRLAKVEADKKALEAKRAKHGMQEPAFLNREAKRENERSNARFQTRAYRREVKRVRARRLKTAKRSVTD